MAARPGAASTTTASPRRVRPGRLVGKLDPTVDFLDRDFDRSLRYCQQPAGLHHRRGPGHLTFALLEDHGRGTRLLEHHIPLDRRYLEILLDLEDAVRPLRRRAEDLEHDDNVGNE